MVDLKCAPKPAPVEAKFWTPGVMVMVAFMVTALPFIIERYLGGLAAVTNLDNTYPWGLWIGVDVATGVALAAGGFSTAALAHIFGRHQYEAVTRPALLTAMLGYTIVTIGLFIDIAREILAKRDTLVRCSNGVMVRHWRSQCCGRGAIP